MTTTFFLPNQHQVDQIKNAHPDRDWHLFGTDAHMWIGQTYLRLIRAGHIVVLSANAPASGTVVTHADFIPQLLATRSLLSDLTIVSVRGDRSPQRHADFEVIQNPTSADSQRTLHIQHWPQPGLVQRDPKRGNAAENVAFMGATGDVCLDTAELQKNPTQLATRSNDYSDTDVIVALRKEIPDSADRGSASNLINAWLAGVPAILGPEQAYRDMRRSELDFIEAENAADVRHAIEALKRNPSLYAAMVANGRQRAAEVDVEACTDAWAHLLFEHVPFQKPRAMSLLRRSLDIMRYRMQFSIAALSAFSRLRSKREEHAGSHALAEYTSMS